MDHFGMLEDQRRVARGPGNRQGVPRQLWFLYFVLPLAVAAQPPQLAVSICTSIGTIRERYATLIEKWWKLQSPSSIMDLQGVILVDRPVGFFQHISARLPPGLRLYHSSQPENLTLISSGQRCGYSQVVDVFKLFPKASWFAMVDDDTFIVRHNLEQLLSTYDDQQLLLLGASTESVAAEHGCGPAVFGGGGAVMSRALAERMAPVHHQCMEELASIKYSDMLITRCALQQGARLMYHPGFHQMDVHGSPLGILEAHPIYPFISLHRPRNIQHLMTDTTMEALALNPASTLQQSVCRQADLGLLSVSSGLSVRWWPHQDQLPMSDVMVPEHTMTDPAKALMFHTTNSLPPSIRFRAEHTTQAQEHDGEVVVEYLYVRSEAAEAPTKGVIHRLFVQPRQSFEPWTLAVSRVVVREPQWHQRWAQSSARLCCKSVDLQHDTLLLVLGRTC